MKKLILSKDEPGYTLVELAVVIALVGLITLTLMVSSGHNIKVERFSGGVNEFANELRETQVNAYSTKGVDCPDPPDPADPACAENLYIRGHLLEFTVDQDHYSKALLLGRDLTAFQGEFNQRRGLTNKRYESTSVPFSNIGGVVLREIGKECTQGYSSDVDDLDDICNTKTTNFSIAFLGPEGRAFVKNQHFSNAQYTFIDEPYDDEYITIFALEDEATGLIGYVTFYPESGNIEVRIR